MNKKLFRIVATFLMLCLFMNGMILPAYAATESGNSDLTVDISMDKESYSNDDEIEIYLDIKNNFVNEINNVDFSFNLPALIMPAEESNTKIHVDSLQPQETKRILLTGKINSTESIMQETPEIEDKPVIEIHDTSDTNTGDKNNIFLYTILILISLMVIFVIVRSKHRKKIISLILCLLLLGESLTAHITAYANETDKSDLTTFAVFKTKNCEYKSIININDKEYVISLNAKYSTNDNLSLNIGSFNFDNNDNIYYLSNVTDNISGTVTNAAHIKKFCYVITDASDNILKEQNIEINENWKSENFGLVVGQNNLTLNVQYDDSTEIKGTIVIHNLCEDNMKNIDVDKNDNDTDGILNYLEDTFKTDKNKADTDGDGLDDYTEIQILDTDPLVVDTDKNGINDGQEDYDKDGLDNLTEINYGLDPTLKDTDSDGIEYNKELDIGTNPLLQDTDGDNASDYWEYMNGYDPRVYNDTFDISSSSKGNEVTASVKLAVDGEYADSLSVEESTNSLLFNKTIPGYVGSAFDFNLDGTFDSAEISFEFPAEKLADNNFDPAIYYYNPETQMLEELVTVIEGNCAKTTVNHFSTYILLNRKEFDAVWAEDIEVTDPEDTSNIVNMVYVIDYSQSMDDNDPNGLRKELTKNFISKLRKDIDKAAIVKFAAYATKMTDLTTDKEKLYNAVNMITNNSGSSCDSEAGTNGSDGIKQALDLLKDEDSQSKYIVFMTDGEDTTTSYDYDSLIKTACEYGVKIFTIGLGDANEELLKKIAEQTAGKYYYATSTTIDDDSESSINNAFEDIESETIDKTSDSNEDGISDYYTKKICEKQLLLGTGASVFNTATYEAIQQNADYDGDGLLNGEELKVVSVGNKVYLKLNSYPDRKNSDDDCYSDYYEVKTLNTNPLVTEMFYDKSDIKYLTNDDEFVATKYKNFYDNKWIGWAEKGSVWIGNNIFGTNYSTVILYKKALMDYFESLEDEESVVAALVKKYNNYSEVLSNILDSIDYAGNILDKINTQQLEKLDGLRNQFDSVSERLTELASQGIALDITQDSDFISLWNSAEDDFIRLAGEIPELETKVSITNTINNTINKIGKGTEKISTVLDIVNIGADIVEFIDSYSTFTSNMELIEQNIYILDTIISNTTNKKLKESCSEIKNQLDSSYYDIAVKAKDFALMLGSDVLDLSMDAILAAIPVVGPYLVVAKVAIDIADFAFNVSDVSEACSYLYAISSCSNIISDAFNTYVSDNMSTYDNSKYIVSQTEVVLDSKSKLFNLAVMRQEAEVKMKEADEANSFLLEWLFADYIYKISDIEDNLNELDTIKKKYVLY